MMFLIKLNPEFSNQPLEEAKKSFALSLLIFVVTGQKMTIIVSFRRDSKVWTAARTAGAVAVFGAYFFSSQSLLGHVFQQQDGAFVCPTRST